MIIQYTKNQQILALESDFAGEYPLYLFLPQDQSTLLYSTSINDLLNDERVPKPLKVSNEGLSFLLQSGVIPPPKTAYEDIYIVGIGDKAEVSTKNGKVQVAFSHQFPFMNANRLAADEIQPDEVLILQMLAEATISRINESKPSFLFHSAGKDSNSIALALAEAGWQNKVTLITHKSKGKADESEICARIAGKLGFKHHILNEVDQLEPKHLQSIDDYFINAPFPCIDDVTLAYPLYAHQVPAIVGSNIIDGMGNDVYIGHIPSKYEYHRQRMSTYLKKIRIISRYFSTESLVHIAGLTRCEWTGLMGLSFNDAKKTLPTAIDVSKYWMARDGNQDYFDFRADIRGTIIDQEKFTRKVRNFSDSINGNIILPWANKRVAEYFSKLPEEYLFDRKYLKNKLILRKILKERIDLDSDHVGKMAFSYDFSKVVRENEAVINKEISSCSAWNQLGIKDIYLRMRSNFRNAAQANDYIYRLYLLSCWLNKCRYIRSI